MLPPIKVPVNIPPTAKKFSPIRILPFTAHIPTATPTMMPNAPRKKLPIIGNPAFLRLFKLTLNIKKKIAIGATYLKIPSYKGVGVDDVGITPKLANMAAKMMTIIAELSCFRYFI